MIAPLNIAIAKLKEPWTVTGFSVLWKKSQFLQSQIQLLFSETASRENIRNLRNDAPIIAVAENDFFLSRVESFRIIRTLKPVRHNCGKHCKYYHWRTVRTSNVTYAQWTARFPHWCLWQVYEIYLVVAWQGITGKGNELNWSEVCCECCCYFQKSDSVRGHPPTTWKCDIREPYPLPL